MNVMNQGPLVWITDLYLAMFSVTVLFIDITAHGFFSDDDIDF